MNLDLSNLPAPVQEALRTIKAIPDAAHVRTAFGEPMQIAGRTIIPVARVGHAFGLGYGSGGEAGRPAGDIPAASGGGGGGGGGVRVMPIAIIEVTPDKTTIRPIVDITRVALLGILLTAWNVFWIARTVREIARARAEFHDEA